MSNILVAIDAALALSTLVTRVIEAQTTISATLKQAQEQGRDLTDEELKAIQDMRLVALAEWEALAPK